MRMDGRQLRRYCEAKLADLAIPSPFDLDAFCAALGRERDRPVVLVPIALPGRAPCGMWAVTDDADYIFVQKQTSPLHQALIGLHEVSHLLFGHTGSGVGDGTMGGASGAEERTEPVFAPNLDPETVRYMLRRTHYSAAAERQAEMLASLILAEVGAWAPAEPAGPLPPEVNELVERLEASLAHGGTQRRV
jgi:hypothetical protein